jgi:hypothetical protein
VDLPNSALHQTLLVVYSILWAGILPSLARLRVFAMNPLDAAAWNRLFWGVLLGNALPITLLAALMVTLPPVGGFWGVVAGGAFGLLPTTIPRLTHAATASNSALRRHHTPREARTVLCDWDKQWAERPTKGWERDDWGRLNLNHPDLARNNLSAHLGAFFITAVPPALTGVLIVCFAS